MAPRVVVLGLASDFGCQVQLTNMEDDLLDILGLIDLSFWQLATSGDMPPDYDVAIIEGAVTTDEHVELLKSVRETADAIIAIGSCAVTGGIPGMANLLPLDDRYAVVYGDGEAVAAGRRAPMPIESVIDVDYRVPGCPIDRGEFMRTLSHALQGMRDRVPDMTMCASCKIAENVCFFDRDMVCLGLVTRAGCDAKCPSLGRPCTGCRGIAEDANLESAREVLASHGISPSELDGLLLVYNAAREVRA